MRAPRSVPATTFALPDALSATVPPEARGVPRDRVRLLVAGAVSSSARARAASTVDVVHSRFDRLAEHLEPGDLVVVNTSRTLPAAVSGRLLAAGARRAADRAVVVHVAAELEDGLAVELRHAPDATRPVLDAQPGDEVVLDGRRRLRLVGPWPVRRPDGAVRVWRAAVVGPVLDVSAHLGRYGRPVRYGYVHGRWPLAAYQTVFADAAAGVEPALAPAGTGSAEMPSAGRPFSDALVTRLVARGVVVAPVVLHTGVSSPDAGEPPLPEPYAVPPTTAALVGLVRRRGGRVVAVGTTVTRALESAVGDDGHVRAAAGWTDLVLGPDRPARVVDGLVTGLHAPEASHLLLLEAVAGPAVVQAAYDAALAEGYLWHEFGDTCLLLGAAPR